MKVVAFWITMVVVGALLTIGTAVFSNNLYMGFLAAAFWTYVTVYYWVKRKRRQSKAPH